MARKATGLEEPLELARRINRWPALRNEPGDERAYELANAVQKLHGDVLHNTEEIAAGLEKLAPLLEQVKGVRGGGGLFAEAKDLVRRLEALRPR